MSVRPLRSVRTGFLLAVTLLVSQSAACSKDEGPGKLVEEDGVWSLQAYDLDGEGSLRQVDAMARGDAFLLQFDSANDVVTAAWCGLDEADTPSSSTCRLQADEARWFCRCFAYAYEESQMRWVEFDAGKAPPPVTLEGAEPPPADEGETDDADGGGGDDGGGDSGLIILNQVAGQSATYDFRPLPAGVFASNGETSRFRMQQKARRLFDNVTCTPCAGG